MNSLKGRPRRLYAFRYGWEPVPESVSLRGGSDDVYLFEPVTGAAVVYDEGWVLIDTGLNPDILRDPALRAAHYTSATVACVPTGDPLLRQIEAAGLSLSNLALCAISHLHCDHGGGLRHLVGGPPIAIQRREHAFAMEEAGLEHAYFRSDYDRTGLAWHLVEGEVELAPGLRALPTFGHTPGHQSFVVELPGSGTIVLACDAADLRRNIDDVIPCGETTHEALADEASRSIERLHVLDRQPRTEVWPGHDPVFWATRRAPPGAYA
jgi:N-acyl homoserine lactone hydrolase